MSVSGDLSFASPTRITQQPTPDEVHEGARKRKRRVLACNECRQKKVSCDRRQPACTRCERSGKSASCVYGEDGRETMHHDDVTDPVPNDALAPDPTTVRISRVVWDDMMMRLLQQEQTITRLQATGNTVSITTPPNSLRAVPTSTTARSSDERVSLVRGKGLSTKYVGPTATRGALWQVSEAHPIYAFTKD